VFVSDLLEQQDENRFARAPADLFLFGQESFEEESLEIIYFEDRSIGCELVY